MLDWTHLQTIALLGTHGSLSAVARELKVHSTTVARRLAAAEAAVGTQIFLRSGARIEPTPMGRLLLESLSPLRVPMERIARSFEQREEDKVRVATTENGARILAACVIPRLLEIAPEVQVEVLSSNIVRDLEDGRVDFALRVIEPTEPHYVRRRVGSVRYGLYGADSYLKGRTTVDCPSTERVLLPGGELATSMEARYFAAEFAGAQVVLRCSSLIALAGAAEQGLGLVVLPTNLAVFHPSLRLIRRLDDAIEPRNVVVVYHSARVLSPTLQTVLDIVFEKVSAFLQAC
jgi:DNA-binding transcriptional LysR family regulator